MHPLDMDKIESWPVELTDFLSAHSGQLRRERQADHDYSLSPSTYRIEHDAPPMPKWEEAKVLAEQLLLDRDLLAFHATRLIDFDHVRNEGLIMLDLERHIEGLKGHLLDAGATEEMVEVDAAVTKMLDADGWFTRRQGAVWATPMRKSLHDGGCDVFYESYGGEAMERIAGYAKGKLEGRLKTLGTPAVVVFRYPAYREGWCRFTAGRLSQSLIELFLQNEGDWEAMDYGWDIMIKRSVPADRILSVLPRDHADVAVASIEPEAE